MMTAKCAVFCFFFWCKGPFGLKSFRTSVVIDFHVNLWTDSARTPYLTIITGLRFLGKHSSSQMTTPTTIRHLPIRQNTRNFRGQLFSCGDGCLLRLRQKSAIDLITIFQQISFNTNVGKNGMSVNCCGLREEVQIM